MIRYILSISCYMLVGVIAALFLGCSVPTEGKLSQYIKNIPEEESINASLYNYELILADVQTAYKESNYQQVFDIYEQYEEVFFESPVIDESELIYWLGLSLNKIFNYLEGTPPTAFNTNFFNYLKANPKRKSLFAIQFEGKYVSNKNGETLPARMYYGGKHFFDIINQRVDYALEKKALREVYSQKFTNAEKSDKANKNNFQQLYWIVTHYPDLFTQDEYNNLKNKYLNINEFKKPELEKLARIDSIIALEAGESIIETESNFEQGGGYPICFPGNEPIVVYNRTDWLSSRNLTTIQIWEPFQVISPLKDENKSNTWYEVRFKDERSGYIDEESYENSCTNELFNKPAWGKLKTKYLSAYGNYIKQDYLTVVEQLSGLLYDLENRTQENEIFLVRLWGFFYKNLNAIAIRSTSLKNPFTAFAIEHDEYFEVSKDQINLEVTDYFLKKVIEVDAESPMLQYFEGFN